MKAEEQARADIVEVGRRLWERGYVASNDGNISVRLDEHRLITTPKSVSKGFMTPDMMVITDLDGKKISGERDPSSEIKMHLQVYRDRPDARAVVHAHPPTATGFAIAGRAVGDKWEDLQQKLHYVDYLIVAGIIAGIAYLLIKRRRSGRPKPATETTG